MQARQAREQNKNIILQTYMHTVSPAACSYYIKKKSLPRPAWSAAYSIAYTSTLHGDHIHVGHYHTHKPAPWPPHQQRLQQGGTFVNAPKAACTMLPLHPAMWCRASFGPPSKRQFLGTWHYGSLQEHLLLQKLALALWLLWQCPTLMEEDSTLEQAFSTPHVSPPLWLWSTPTLSNSHERPV